MAHVLAGVGHLQAVDFDRHTGRMKTETFGAEGKPVLIMMYGSYCGWCKKASPDFLKVFHSQKQKKLFMAAIQTDDTEKGAQELMKFFPAILAKSGIKFNGVPTYILYKDGIYSEVNGRDEQSLMSLINSL